MIAALYVLLCLIWGSTWLVIKIGLDGVPPFLGAGLRFLLASSVLFGLIAARRVKIRLQREDKIAILSCGLVSFTFSYAVVYWAEQYISTGLTAILYCTMPLIVALLSRFWMKSERLTRRKLGGIFIGMIGTAVLFWPDEALSWTKLAVMLLVLTSAAAAAFNLVTIKKYGRHTDVYVLNACGMAIGAACLLGLSFLTESAAAVLWTPTNVLAIVYLGLIGSVAAFLSYFHLIKVMDATPLSMITLIFPLVAVGLGRLFLGETVSGPALAGIAIVLGGVAITLT